MKKQKIISSLLAAALMVPLCTTAFAAATQPTPTTVPGAELTEAKTTTDITIGSTIYLPTIKVSIKDGTSIITNPYKMDFDSDGDGTADMNDSIISVPTVIESTSTIKMDINAKPTLTTNSQTLDVRTEPITDTTQKSIYLVYNTNVISGKGGTAKTVAEGYDGVAGQHQPIKKEADATSSDVVNIQLPAADSEDVTNDAVYAAFKITGDCSGKGWTSADAVTIKVAFDISPVMGS